MGAASVNWDCSGEGQGKEVLDEEDCQENHLGSLVVQLQESNCSNCCPCFSAIDHDDSSLSLPGLDEETSFYQLFLHEVHRWSYHLLFQKVFNL